MNLKDAANLVLSTVFALCYVVFGALTLIAFAEKSQYAQVTFLTIGCSVLLISVGLFGDPYPRIP